MTRNTRTFAALAVVLALSISGCTLNTHDEPSAGPTSVASSKAPSPAPGPAKPAISQLVVTPDGLGPLAIDQAPPVTNPDLDIAIFVPDYCAAEPEAPEKGMWRANYPSGSAIHPPFFPVVADGVLRDIAIFSPDIKTKTGIGMGSTRAEVLAAYPGGFASQVDNTPYSTVYIVAGTTGRLLIEVRSDDTEYWNASERGTVNVLTVIAADITPFAVSGSDNYDWGVCVGP